MNNFVKIGLIAVPTLATAVVGALGYNKIKMQDEAIDRMLESLEKASEAIESYTETIENQNETIKRQASEINKLRKQLNEKDYILKSVTQDDITIDEETGNAEVTSNAEFEEMKKEGKGKTIPFNVFCVNANPVNTKGFPKSSFVKPEEVEDTVKKSDDDYVDYVYEPNLEQFAGRPSSYLHSNVVESSNIWDENPSYDSDIKYVSLEVTEEDQRRYEESFADMKYEVNSVEALHSFYDMIVFPYKNDALMGVMKGIQFAEKFGIPFNRREFDGNKFVDDFKSLFDYQIPLADIQSEDAGIFDDLLDNRLRYFGPTSKWVDASKITFGELIDYIIRRAGYDLDGLNWAVVANYILNAIEWNSYSNEEARSVVVSDILHHGFYNSSDKFGLFGLDEDYDQDWGQTAGVYSFRNEWNSFLSRVLNYEEEHESWEDD